MSDSCWAKDEIVLECWEMMYNAMRGRVIHRECDVRLSSICTGLV